MAQERETSPPKQRTSPDYEKYSRGVVRDTKNKIQRNAIETLDRFHDRGYDDSRYPKEERKPLKRATERVIEDTRRGTRDIDKTVPSYKRGGVKRKAGVARLHGGEKIKRGTKRAKKGRE